jgi:hypothetical protein
MNTFAPLPPEQLDELLSADLDGEFDAAARDFGMEPAEARERIAITPGAKERELSLAVARAAVAEVSPLDDATAARLRANAAAALNDAHEVDAVDELAARRRKRYRVLASAGAIAAAVALVLGIVANTNSSDDSAKTATAAPSANSNGTSKHPARTVVPATLNLGEAKTADELEQRLNVQLNAGSTTEFSSNDSARSDQAFIDAGTATTQALAPTAKQLKAATTTRCDKVAHDLTGVNDPPTLRATGKVGDAPVVVYVFRSGTNEIVLMLNTKCQYVFRQARPAS